MVTRNLYAREFTKLAAGDFSGVKLIVVPVEPREKAGAGKGHDSDTDVDPCTPDSVCGEGAGAAALPAVPVAPPAIQVPSGPAAAPATAGKGAAGRGDTAIPAKEWVRRIGSTTCVFNDFTVFKRLYIGAREGELDLFRDPASGTVYVRCSQLLDVACNLAEGEGSKVTAGVYLVFAQLQ